VPRPTPLPDKHAEAVLAIARRLRDDGFPAGAVTILADGGYQVAWGKDAASAKASAYEAWKSSRDEAP
jgi:hypothetical protein